MAGLDEGRLEEMVTLAEHCVATSTGSGSFPLSLGRKLAQNSLELAAEVEWLRGRLEAIEGLLRDPVESGEDVEAWRVLEAVRGQ